ncbi:hypothetical protein GOP47_0022883 [Adiantum capillus-veneris]|uniref:non-specific serine/threonine protein kinase n=1 Tax=Adiantum capillus-veneris TaxID=13818 RepID=A0A9D4U685_ADICA|nr:hypothetical protein GOP47_0022883 [Adiantum capillus-veneris]
MPARYGRLLLSPSPLRSSKSMSAHAGAHKGLLSLLGSSFSCFGCQKGAADAQESFSSTSSTDEFISQVLPENASALLFTMEELKKATSCFSSSCQIGQGSFGTVYKGRLTDGKEVAVKRARKDIFEARLTVQFQCEVNLLASVEHLNLVKLLGYFEGGNERILVQEYVPNGNLRQHLDCEFGVVLDLFVRLDIAIDIAHALTYLHFYAERPIIHRDIKASNILLTPSFRAKVCDFGFARVGAYDPEATHVSTQVKGTAGYLDPEYLKSYQLSTKSDVYSFGILLIELITGRRPIELQRVVDQRITARWAFKNFLSNNLADVLDPKLERSESAHLVAGKVCKLAFQCSAPTRHDRPEMKQVVEYLWAVRKEYQALLEQKVSESLLEN